MRPAQYDRSVFVNCPFDRFYEPIFRAILFSICSAELIPRCASEMENGGENRLEKIFRIIGECRYGIHDISRTELDIVHVLPRFNMPLELGLFLGCMKFGGKVHGQKSCLILDRERYRYRKFLSDLAGQDVHAHYDDPRTAMAQVRSWLRTTCGRGDMPGGEEIWSRYQVFQQDLPDICQGMKLQPKELTFADLVTAIGMWQRQHRATAVRERVRVSRRFKNSVAVRPARDTLTAHRSKNIRTTAGSNAPKR